MPLPPDLSLGHVHLTVSDLVRSLAFYQNALGFKVHRREGETVYLGGGQTDLLALTETTGARLYPNRTGLYHFALLVPSRLELAQSLKHIGVTRTPVQGFADHLVSEAIYLADPEGNGIELYRDRPRSDWPDPNDALQNGNLPLDLRKLLEEADQAAAQDGKIDPQTDIGHIHLQVSDLDATKAFYLNLLGLDVMMSLPTALFFSAGDYHHHVGANIWNSRNAPRRGEDMTGLRSFAFLIPDEAGWLALHERLQTSSRPLKAAERDGRLGVTIEDQDGTAVEFLTPETEAVRKTLASLLPTSV